MSELTKEKIYKKELEKVGGEGNNNLERIRSLGPYATVEYVNTLMSGALKRAIVEELPTTDIDTNTIYMVFDSEATSGNVYNEYLYINEAWELIGTTAMETPHLYAHYINMQQSGAVHINLVIYSNDNTQFTYSTILSWLINNGFVHSTNNFYNATGYYDNGRIALGLAPSSGGYFKVSYEYIDNGTLTHDMGDALANAFTVTDTVKQIF